MQHAPAPATQGDIDRASAFRVLAQARFQTSIQGGATRQCIEKCIFTEDLYTSDRATWPIKPRLDKDMAEKTCVKNCGQKYEELFSNLWMRANQKEIEAAQAESMMQMMMPPQ
eukprot:GILI01036144.1.p1 GENE.GILI01036144.1~~GILI01036144.1.p1  ORF type:complete len:113 (-),score=13.67 GILI01036144.1:93-431(-)